MDGRYYGRIPSGRTRVKLATVVSGRTVRIAVNCYTCRANGTAEFEATAGQRVADVASGARAMLVADHKECE